MRTTWKYSADTETLRLLQCAHQIAVGFYKINNFYPLPNPNQLNIENSVYFPDLPYLSISRFWDQVKLIDTSTLPIKAPISLISQTKKLLSVMDLASIEYEQTEKHWLQHQNKILNEIFKQIPNKAGQVSQITIMPTTFGTGGSFSLHKKPGDPINIWLRQDKGIAEITESIVTSLTRQNIYNQLGGLWQESEIIADWLITFSPLGKLLQNLGVNVERTLTIKNTRSTQNALIVQASEKFMRKIGAPVVSLSQVDTSLFSSREKDIYQLLLAHSPQPATFNEIGDLLFKNNPDEYSLFAISKSIQRLRDKFEMSGISGSYIQTKRGEGYLLTT